MLNKFLSNIKNNAFAKSVIKIASGSGIAQIVAIISMPILSHIYTPEDFGVFAMFFSITSILSGYATLRYEYALPIAKTDKEAWNVFQLILFSLVLISCIAIVFFVCFGDWFMHVMDVQKLKPYLFYIPIVVFLNGLYMGCRYLALREKSFNNLMIAQINKGVGQSVFKIGFGFLKKNSGGLIYSTIIGHLFPLLSFVKLVKNFSTKARNGKNIKLFEVAKKYKKFPLISSWQVLLGTIYAALPIFIINKLFSTSEVGAFSFAQKIVFFPVTFLSASIGQVFLAQAAEAIKNNNYQAVRSLSRSLSKKLFFIGVIVFMPIIIFGGMIFSFVFGDQWQLAGDLSQIIAFSAISRLAFLTISNIFNIIEKQFLGVCIEALKALSMFGLYYISKKLGFSMQTAVSVMVVMLVTLNILTFCIAQVTIQKFIHSKQKAF